MLSLIDMFLLRKVYEVDYPWITKDPSKGPNIHYSNEKILWLDL